ncbi:hypothetical protein ATN84_07140 [Paramesorhizobium deserti]|uniref:Uncharacterized protein n=1 Tax=Paramesorhizobium deserti TaxID=1494590 RepID=A0A135HVG9_9HYPH|nr:hypothetical protein ATN84_07140 [Paramesorhizobium deserti]
MARQARADAFGCRRVVWHLVALRGWQDLTQRVISPLDFLLLGRWKIGHDFVDRARHAGCFR